jgi:hypothetical protein
MKAWHTRANRIFKPVGPCYSVLSVVEAVEANIAKVGFGRKPAVYPAGAESRLVDIALKLSKMV